MDDVAQESEWGEVLARLASAHDYWLATSDPRGGPHVAPVWGVVTGDAFHFYSQRSTAKARHVAVDPRVALHLADPDDVTIVYGTLDDLGVPGAHPDVLAAFAAKYDGPGEADYLPTATGSDDDVLYRLAPTRALAWSLDDFEGSQRRWGA